VNRICTQDPVTKIGPWGGGSGRPSDVDVLPRRLISVVIHSGRVINSLMFTYSDCDGQQHSAGPWGGTANPLEGSSHTVSTSLINNNFYQPYVADGLICI
jgi:hypothetical protein